MTAWLPSAVPSAWIASILLGIVCGLLGTFVVIRRMALTGDMLSHAVLPGVVMGLAWNASRNPLIVLGCAVAAGLLGSLAMRALLRHTKLKPDAALALVLSVFFSLGIALISKFSPPGVQAFLYGQVAAIDRNDLLLLCLVTAATLVLVPLSFRHLLIVSFDAPYAQLLGLPVRTLETCFFFLLTVVIVIAMQAVGVILVTAMLVTPAAAARFCTPSLVKIALLACVFGVAGGLAGVTISATWGNLPTGPLMALSVTVLFGFAAAFGTRGGWIPGLLRRRRERSRILQEDILKGLWHLEETQDADVTSPLSALHSIVPGSLRGALKRLERQSLISFPAGGVRMTRSGRTRATQLVRAHRLWETYLHTHAAYKADHLHEDAERAEHWIDETGRRRLEQNLGHPQQDPHGSPIPPPKDRGKDPIS